MSLFSWQTPLHLGVITDRSDIVRRLLEAEASPNTTDRHGQTCFHLAVKNQTIDCLKTLIDSSKRPPDIDALSYDGMLHAFVIIIIIITIAIGLGGNSDALQLEAFRRRASPSLFTKPIRRLKSVNLAVRDF